jgi:hypothetical protein
LLHLLAHRFQLGGRGEIYLVQQQHVSVGDLGAVEIAEAIKQP